MHNICMVFAHLRLKSKITNLKRSEENEGNQQQQKRIGFKPLIQSYTTAIIFIITLIFRFTPALFEIYILSFLVDELDQIGDHNLKHELEKYKFFYSK